VEKGGKEEEVVEVVARGRTALCSSWELGRCVWSTHSVDQCLNHELQHNNKVTPLSKARSSLSAIYDVLYADTVMI
jgi:hypothetical protein